MKILVISEPFVGLRDFFHGLTDQDSGQPGFYQVLKELDRQGHQALVIVPSSHGKSQSTRVWSNTRIFAFRPLIFADKWKLCRRIHFLGVDLRFFLNLLQAIYYGWGFSRHEKFDLVTGHWEFAALAAYIIGRLRGIPNISRLYGSNLIGRTQGRLTFFNKIQNLNRVIPFITPAALFICTQDGTQSDKAAAHFSIPKTKFIHILNGVEKNAPSSSKPEHAPLDITFIGHLQGWKNPMRVLEMVPDVIKYNTGVRFNFVGSGVEESQMRRYIGDHGLEPYVNIHGRLTQEEKNQILADTDIYVSFYSFTNLTNTMLEALACGKAILTTNEGDTALVLENERNAVLLPAWDRQRALEELLCLIDQPDKRQKLGKAARDWAVTCLKSWEERARLEIQYYQGVIAEEASAK